MLEQIIEAIEQGRSISLSGPAGSGKSYIIDRLKEKYQNRMVVTATTGIAAMNVKGITVHSFTGMGTVNHIENIRSVYRKEAWGEARSRIARYDIHVIDECSMFSGDQLELVSELYKQACLQSLYDEALTIAEIEEQEKIIKSKPFGGKIMIFTGDYLQLPPIIKDMKKCTYQWAFQSKAWNELDLLKINLEKIWRQDDPEFQDLLNLLRIGRCTGKVTKKLQERMIEVPDDVKPVKLGMINKIVDEYNQKELDKLGGNETLVKGNVSWNKKYDDEEIKNNTNLQSKKKYLFAQLVKTSMAPLELRIKKDCKLMILENDVDGEYVNGSTGKLIKGVYLLNVGIEKYSNVINTLRDYGIIDYIDVKEKENNRYYEDYEGKVNLKESRIYDHYYEVSNKSQAEFLKSFIEKHCFTGKRNRIKTVSLSQALIIELDNETKKKVYVQRSDKFQLITGECKQEWGIEPDVIMSQFPVKLGYAITSHKSQGMTLENVEIDFERAFAEGQVYVVLGRVKSFEGLYLRNFHPSMVKANIDALNFYRED
jgi:ATP-dependent DNA helicase PIF1